MVFKNLLALVALGFTLLSVVATSEKQKSFYYGNYELISDCESPVRDQVVTVSLNQISLPAATSFLDFGFPSATVVLGQEVSGTVGAVTRTCTPTFGDTIGDGKDYVFSCYDNGAAACTILVKAQ